MRSDPHRLDWANRPLPFKIYETLIGIPLPADSSLTMPALQAIAAMVREGPRQIPDLAALARIFYLSNGVTKVLRVGGQPYHYRAASCTGALYHIELYLVCGDLPGLGAGVYHYGAHDHALRQLRSGDFRDLVVRATGNEPHLAHAPAIVICTDTFWRNTWKYQARAYRHSGWDNGVILANLLATAAALPLPANVVSGFADDEINRLLSLDQEKEAAFSIVSLGRDDTMIPPAPETVPLDLPTAPLSRYQVDYPLLREMHADSSLQVDEVAAWRGELPRAHGPAPNGPLFPLADLNDRDLPADSLDTVIKRRGSSRQFTLQPITFNELSAILTRSTGPLPADFSGPSGSSLNDLYLIANAVEGLPAGSYVYHRETEALEQLQQGDMREQAGYLDLEQELAHDAAVNIYYLAALDPILERYGNRGYRAVQLEAGILGGKIYLAAYAQGLGATGLTFYDDEVIRFFSPHAEDKSAIFLMTVGHARKRGSP